jgi:hypothetical protein
MDIGKEGIPYNTYGRPSMADQVQVAYICKVICQPLLWEHFSYDDTIWLLPQTKDCATKQFFELLRSAFDQFKIVNKGFTFAYCIVCTS